MDASFSNLGNGLTVRVELTALSVDDRRNMLRALLFDKDVNPGQTRMTDTERREAHAVLDRFCGWGA
jgi:hypothetical protein